MELKKRIENRGLKISWIADQIKVKQPTLSMYLSGKRTMPTHIKLSIEKLIS